MKVYNTIDSAREAALEASKHGHYTVLVNCFGLSVSCRKYLWNEAKSDSYTDTYWYNGKERGFTERQIINSQQVGWGQ
jgi:hypothetical protein